MILENNDAKKALEKIENNEQAESVKGLFFDGAAHRWITFEYESGSDIYDQEEFLTQEKALEWLQ